MEQLQQLQRIFEKKFLSDGFIHNSLIISSTDLRKTLFMLFFHERHWSEASFDILTNEQKILYSMWVVEFKNLVKTSERLREGDIFERHRVFMTDFASEIFPFDFPTTIESLSHENSHLVHCVTLEKIPIRTDYHHIIRKIVYSVSGFPNNDLVMSLFSNPNHYLCYFTVHTNEIRFQIFRNNYLILDKIKMLIQNQNPASDTRSRILMGNGSDLWVSIFLDFCRRVQDLNLNDAFANSNKEILLLITNYPDIFSSLRELLSFLISCLFIFQTPVHLDDDEKHILLSSPLSYILEKVSKEPKTQNSNILRLSQLLKNWFTLLQTQMLQYPRYDQMQSEPWFQEITNTVLYKILQTIAKDTEQDQTKLVETFLKDIISKCNMLCLYIDNYGIGFFQIVGFPYTSLRM